MEKKKKEDKYYLPRDISWMYFNRRILQEAMKERVPILERLSFLGIYSNNLDEFFRVRVATQSHLDDQFCIRINQCGKVSGHFTESSKVGRTVCQVKMLPEL